MAIHVTVWNEYLHEKQFPEIASIYPKGIHGCIADFLQKAGIGCRLASPLHRQQSAAGVALAAEHLAAQGLMCSAQELQPVYLRLSQAERERLARGLSLTAE